MAFLTTDGFVFPIRCRKPEKFLPTHGFSDNGRLCFPDPMPEAGKDTAGNRLFFVQKISEFVQKIKKRRDIFPRTCRALLIPHSMNKPTSHNKVYFSVMFFPGSSSYIYG